mgnify:CR=1 FL=1
MIHFSTFILLLFPHLCSHVCLAHFRSSLKWGLAALIPALLLCAFAEQHDPNFDVPVAKRLSRTSQTLSKERMRQATQWTNRYQVQWGVPPPTCSRVDVCAMFQQQRRALQVPVLACSMKRRESRLMCTTKGHKMRVVVASGFVLGAVIAQHCSKLPIWSGARSCPPAAVASSAWHPPPWQPPRCPSLRNK